ncbi:MAG: alpha/beta fold hydrolase [Myxococcales bacterium]|nr:alpha/beta fold hydrolase [Myxococcales bacterium]
MTDSTVLPETAKPTVVLLHGLARSKRSLAQLRHTLENAGYTTWSVTYPSRKASVVESAQWVKEQICRELPDQKLFAVTHSLGGILVRLLSADLPWVGAVLIAPPNQGSVVASTFQSRALFRWVYGPAGQDVCSPTDWPLPPAPFGVIAGTRSRAWGNPTSWVTHTMSVLPRSEKSDGTLLVNETKLSGMRDFVLVDASHTWIMNHPETQQHVLAFLRSGKFASLRTDHE